MVSAASSGLRGECRPQVASLRRATRTPPRFAGPPQIYNITLRSGIDAVSLSRSPVSAR